MGNEAAGNHLFSDNGVSNVQTKNCGEEIRNDMNRGRRTGGRRVSYVLICQFKSGGDKRDRSVGLFVLSLFFHFV
jgi:hypothetical protein